MISRWSNPPPAHPGGNLHGVMMQKTAHIEARQAPDSDGAESGRGAGSIRVRLARARRIAARQHGVVTRRQLLEAGWSSSAIHRRVRSGQLQRLHRGVCLVHVQPGDWTYEQAAVLRVGDPVVLSHFSAIRVWGLVQRAPVESASGPRHELAVPTGAGSRPIHVTVCPSDRRCGEEEPTIRLHRTRSLPRECRALRHGLPVTSPARTLLDIAAVADRSLVEQVLARAVQDELVTSDEVRRLPRRFSGRPGAPVIRRIVERDRTPAYMRSRAEAALMTLIEEADLPRPETNVRVAGAEVDCFWRDHALVVEVDGFEFHRSRSTFESDRRRDQRLIGQGIRVLRVTWKQVTLGRLRTAARLAAALSSVHPGKSKMGVRAW